MCVELYCTKLKKCLRGMLENSFAATLALLDELGIGDDGSRYFLG